MSEQPEEQLQIPLGVREEKEAIDLNKFERGVDEDILKDPNNLKTNEDLEAAGWKIVDRSKQAPPRRNDRITIALNLYHEHKGSQPSHISVRKSMILKEQEEPWSRRKEFSETWEVLPEWMPYALIGTIVIENLAGSNLLVNPTKEERAAIDASIIEVAVASPQGLISQDTQGFFEVPPSWPLFFMPVDASRIRVRCRSGKCWTKLHLISK